MGGLGWWRAGYDVFVGSGSRNLNSRNSEISCDNHSVGQVVFLGRNHDKMAATADVVPVLSFPVLEKIKKYSD